MGRVMVDQIGPGGVLVSDVDTTLSESQKSELFTDVLPGARSERYAGQRVIRFRNHVILKAQVTYLGTPWESFKKRIQIPRRWVDVYQQAVEDGLSCRFVGVYHYAGATIFVDFDPATYVTRKANNSAAHVATNDLFQATRHGMFARTDSNGNRLVSLRSDTFADYLLGNVDESNAWTAVLDAFNRDFMQGERFEALNAVKDMHAAGWPDAMQGEWAGFYLEHRLDEFLRRTGSDRFVSFRRDKRRGGLDYDLAFLSRGEVAFYGDLKASDITKRVSPGNDAEDIARALREYGRFWYVVYEHRTWHSRNERDLPVTEWNEWRRSVGHARRSPYDPLSYARRFKSAVQFVQMLVLEVNEANAHVVLGDFKQGRQPGGASRALKVMISKRKIDNFLIMSSIAS